MQEPLQGDMIHQLLAEVEPLNKDEERAIQRLMQVLKADYQDGPLSNGDGRAMTRLLTMIEQATSEVERTMQQASAPAPPPTKELSPDDERALARMMRFLHTSYASEPLSPDDERAITRLIGLFKQFKGL
jgi:hypothetical protein